MLGHISEENEGKYTIGEFARLLGVSPRTIDFYTRQGLLHPDQNGRGHGYRHYTEDDRRRVSLIKQLQARKFSLQEIRQDSGILRLEEGNLARGSHGTSGPGSGEGFRVSVEETRYVRLPSESTRDPGGRHGSSSKGDGAMLRAGDSFAGFATHVGGLEKEERQ